MGIVVWALFDDGESSYKNAIEKNFYDDVDEVHSIGINDVDFGKSEKFFYHKIDLSLINLNLIRELKQLKKPDVVLASPPCESWSIADCSGKMFVGLDDDGNWKIRNKKYYDEYNKNCNVVKRRDFEQKEFGRIAGEATIGGTIKIINFFKPLVWVIENPATSKTWEFQNKHWGFDGVLNKTYYSSYDENFSLKPTIFKSNIKLDFRNEKLKGNKRHMAFSGYNKRSAIPEKLIVDLMSQVLVEVNKKKKLEKEVNDSD